MAIFFNIVFNLPFVSIACFSQNIPDASEYFGIRQDFLGIVYEKLKEFDKAVDAYKKAIELFSIAFYFNKINVI